AIASFERSGTSLYINEKVAEGLIYKLSDSWDDSDKSCLSVYDDNGVKVTGDVADHCPPLAGD
ncbi:MAG: hypothetical protein AAB069_07730, partial [Planctomycetota bacterium]